MNYRLSKMICMFLSAFAATVTAQTDCPIAEVGQLSPSDAITNQNFGSGLAMDGDILVVGSPNDTVNLVQDGSAYIFREVAPGQWEEQQKVTTSEQINATHLGIFGSPAVSGGTIAVGAPHGFFNVGFFAPGRVYIYEEDQTTGQWVEVQNFEAPDAVPSDIDNFGGDVILHQDFMFVGAVDANQTGTGAVYFYEKGADGLWSFVQKIQPMPVQIAADGFGQFGDCIVYDPDEQLLLISDPAARTSTAEGSGAVYAYHFEDGLWEQEAEILPPVTGDDNFMGESLSYQNGRLLVGDIGGIAPFEPGSVREFERVAPGAWEFRRLFNSHEAAPNDRFGTAIKQFGDFAFVQASFLGLPNGEPTINTVVDLYEFDGSDWQFVRRVNPAGDETGSFGINIEITTDGTMLVSDFSAFNQAAVRSGIVRIYQVDCAGQFELGDINLDGSVDLLDVQPFVELLTTGTFQAEADMNGDGSVNLLDVQLFVNVISS